MIREKEEKGLREKEGEEKGDRERGKGVRSVRKVLGKIVRIFWLFLSLKPWISLLGF